MLSHGLLNYLTFKLFYLPIMNRYIYIHIISNDNVNVDRDLRTSRSPSTVVFIIKQSIEAKSRQNESQSMSPLKVR